MSPATAPIVALAVTALTAGTGHAACTAPEHRQFDFWLGRWEVFTPDGQRAGENRIEAVAGACALLESWQGRGGFTGHSLNGYDAQTKQWHQHWVDSQGSRLVLAGAWNGRAMVLSSDAPHPELPGRRRLERISWLPGADGSVRQHWERSDDGGRTWATVFDGKYQRLR